MVQKRKREKEKIRQERAQRNQNQEEGLLILKLRRTGKMQKNCTDLVSKKMPPEREIAQRKRRKIEQDINLPVTQVSTREHVPLQSAVGVETARTMIQVMKHQMILRGNIPGNNVLHHHLSDLEEDKYRGHLIASILSAGILPTLLLRPQGEGDQDPNHLSGDTNDLSEGFLGMIQALKCKAILFEGSNESYLNSGSGFNSLAVRD